MRSLLAGLVFAAFLFPASARDLDGRFAGSPLKGWFDKLQSGKGLCCTDADGHVISDVDWDTLGPAGTYRVRLGGQWVVVPPEAVITTPNLAKVPMVWPEVGGAAVRCFMPGFAA